MLIYSATTFISAFLLFQVEPMMAKFILPWFGGTQAVWTTCILFFQLLLLAGYAYAHALRIVFDPRKQAIAHVMLVLTCLALMAVLSMAWRSPIMPQANWKPPNPDFPILRILVLLSASVGLPYFVLSATGPLLQVWFTKAHQGQTPYRLYALSNLGSMLALVTYPVVLEPYLRLRSQARLWALLYVAFTLGIGICGWRLRNFVPLFSASKSGTGAVEDCQASRPDAAIYLLWLCLAACASLMLLGVTNQICENVAAIPFLWVLPLAIYLFSFIVCFGNERWYRRWIFHPALGAAVVLACVFLLRSPFGMIVQIAAYSFLLFCACMVCHGELIRLKPPERYLTAFYLMISTGGALGGLLAAVVAPLVFRGYWELQLSIWACALLVLVALLNDRESWIHERKPVLALLIFAEVLLLTELLIIITPKPGAKLFYNSIVTLVLTMIFAVSFRERKSIIPGKAGKLRHLSVIMVMLALGGVLLISVKQANCLIAKRNFYGAVSVVSYDAKEPGGPSYVLCHGRITQGQQFTEPDKRNKPTTYYGPRSGIGLAILNHPRRGAARPQDRTLRVGVVGLGIGTLAAYGQPGDYIRFYEINPAIIELATDPNGYFTYLRDSRARVEIITGDARLSMEREVESGRPQDFDVLAIDAFNGDAIPVHLLTKEAIAVYLRELKADGILAIHITNGYLDLFPVVTALAQYFGLQSGLVHNDDKLAHLSEWLLLRRNRLVQSDDTLTSMSDWVLLARSREVLSKPEIWRNLWALNPGREVRPWTDDYSNLFQILR